MELLSKSFLGTGINFDKDFSKLLPIITAQSLKLQGKQEEYVMKGLNRKSMLIHLIGYIIARATFGGMNPLVIGYFTASCLSNTGGGWAARCSCLRRQT
jgi:hypothetical protein